MQLKIVDLLEQLDYDVALGLCRVELTTQVRL